MRNSNQKVAVQTSIETVNHNSKKSRIVPISKDQNGQDRPITLKKVTNNHPAATKPLQSPAQSLLKKQLQTRPALKQVKKTGATNTAANKNTVTQTTTAQNQAQKSLSKPSQLAAVQQGQADMRMLQVLVALEKEVRLVENVKALKYLAANETRKLVQSRQIYFFEATFPDSDKFQVRAISSVTTPDRNLPVIQWFERMSAAMSADKGAKQANIFTLPTYCADDQEIQTYPFKHMLWVPLKTYDGQVFAGMMMAREQEWQESDQAIAERLADIYSHAWSALLGRNTLAKPKRVTPKLMIGTALVLILAGFMPMSMNTLAPVEVIAQKPVIAAAPIDGVIEKIFVRPNSIVKKGQPLFQFVNTRLRNDYEVSKRAVVVAEAKYKKATQGSFASADAKHNIATARAELELKKAERTFAKENFEKSVVWAKEDGLAVFHSKEQWLGSPVKTGEKIMTIVSRKNAEVRIDLPVSDAIVLKDKARVKVFLDSDPLNPIEAVMTHASYHATPTQDQQLAYRVHADFSDKTKTPPRIGLRGTAQVFGEKTTLFFYLFRRPIAAARQMFGI